MKAKERRASEHFVQSLLSSAFSSWLSFVRARASMPSLPLSPPRPQSHSVAVPLRDQSLIDALLIDSPSHWPSEREEKAGKLAIVGRLPPQPSSSAAASPFRLRSPIKASPSSAIRQSGRFKPTLSLTLRPRQFRRLPLPFAESAAPRHRMEEKSSLGIRSARRSRSAERSNGDLRSSRAASASSSLSTSSSSPPRESWMSSSGGYSAGERGLTLPMTSVLDLFPEAILTARSDVSFEAPISPPRAADGGMARRSALAKQLNARE